MQTPKLIEIFVNDHQSHKERIKCNPSDKIGDLKKLIAFKIGTKPEKIRLSFANKVLSDQVTLDDYEIHHGTQLTMSYQ